MSVCRCDSLKGEGLCLACVDMLRQQLQRQKDINLELVERGEARAAIEGEPQREVGWLIEREDDHRWAIVLPDKLISWTSDSLKALRFSRKEEAELFAELAQFSGPIKVTEHIWMEPI